MSKLINVDPFAKCRLRFGERDYEFRPPSVGDLVDYLDQDAIPRLLKAIKDQSLAEQLAVQIEIIRRYIPALSEEELRNATTKQLQFIYQYVKDGVPPEEDEKN